MIASGLPHVIDYVPRGVPSGLIQVITKALEMDPEKRFQTAAEFARELEAATARVTKAPATQMGAFLQDTFPTEYEETKRLMDRHQCVRRAKGPTPDPAWADRHAEAWTKPPCIELASELSGRRLRIGRKTAERRAAAFSNEEDSTDRIIVPRAISAA